MEQRMTPARKALESVEEARSQVGRLRRSVHTLQGRCTSRTSRLGAASTGKSSPYPELWDFLADQRSLLEQKEKQLRQLEERMERWIDLLPKPRWRMVLRYRYLDGMELPEVAQELSKNTGREFSMNQIYRFHRSALDAADKLWPLS